MKVRGPFKVALFATLFLVVIVLVNRQPDFHPGVDPYGGFRFGLVPSVEAQNIPGITPAFGFVATTSASTSQLLAAAGSGVRNYIQQAQCINSSASTVTVAKIIDGTGSTATTVLPCAAAGVNNGPITFSPPLRLSANTIVALGMSGAVSTAYVWVNGFTGR